MSSSTTGAAAGTAVPNRPTPLLPEAGAAGTPLTVVVAVLAFMASIALASYFMVSRAAANWTGELSGTITVQIKGANSEAITNQANIAADLLDRTPGVLSLRRIDREETARLLEPWLGKDNLTDDIPVPALISAEVSPERRRDLQSLRTALAGVAPDATLDDHGQWNDRLIDAARRSQMIAFVVFAMVMLAAGSIIIFATRAGLAANRNIVEVMHLVGATDQFIASEVQRRYFILGLTGGALGAVAASLILFISASFERESSGFFLPNLGADPSMLIWLVAVPLILCCIAALTARITVLGVLKEA